MILQALRQSLTNAEVDDLVQILDADDFTKEICDIIAAKYPKAYYLAYIPNRFKTREMCNTSVRESMGRELEYVPEHLQTEEICKFAVEHNPYGIVYVYRQTKELCVLAFKNSPKSEIEFDIYDMFDAEVLTPSLFVELINIESNIVRDMDSEDLWKVLPTLLAFTREACKERASNKFELEPEETYYETEVLSIIKSQRIRRYIVRTLTAEKLLTLHDLKLSPLSITEIMLAYATTDTFGPMQLNDSRIERRILGKSRPVLSWDDCWKLAALVRSDY